MPPMSSEDRRRVLIRLIIVVGLIAIAVIGIFQAIPNNVGRDHNECAGGVCGEDNDDNRIGSPDSSK